MAENTAKLAADSVGECAPIAMDIGAAHTADITGLLSQKNVSYASVSPLSLFHEPDSAASPGAPSIARPPAKSVDRPAVSGRCSTVGTSRRPSSNQPWFEEKASVAYIASAIALAASGGQQPPFGLDKGKLGLGGPSQPAGISVDLASIQLVPRDDKTGTDVLFQVTMTRQNLTLWMKVGVVGKTTPAVRRRAEPGEGAQGPTGTTWPSRRRPTTTRPTRSRLSP